MGIIGNRGNAFISFTVAVAATFASLYESFQELTSIQVSHFVEWFSGDALDSIWTLSADISGMVDTIDEGFLIQETGVGTSFINFNDKRHYDPDNSILIAVWRHVSGAQAHGALGNGSNPGSNYASIRYFTGQTNFTNATRDGTSASATEGSVARDSVFHTFKIENISANTKTFIDGVLDVTKTTNLPNVALQPVFTVLNATAMHVRYAECFNTTITLLSSLYERLSALTQVMGQRVVETFTGALLNERWNQSGAGTSAMSDEVDGGVALASTSSSFSSSTISFNTKRQYDFDDSVILIVGKINSLALALMKLGLSSVEGFGPETAHLDYDSAVGTNYNLVTGDASVESTTSGAITADTNYHLFKIECGSANIKLIIDGVLDVTKTTNRPTVKMMPALRSLTRTTAIKTVNVLYCEAYNKLTTEADFPSVYELFNPLTTLAKQHFWDWFDGSALNNRWVTGTSSGGGTFSMADSIDGGFQLVTNSGVFDELNIGFGTFAGTGVRQFSPTASVVIFTIQQSRTTDIGSMVRMWNDNVTGERAVLGVDTGKNASFYILNTGDATTESNTATSVALNTNMNGFKIELDSADIKAFVNGVLEVTKTTNRPTAKLEPQVECISRIASSATTNVRYMECYNT